MISGIKKVSSLGQEKNKAIFLQEAMSIHIEFKRFQEKTISI